MLSESPKNRPTANEIRTSDVYKSIVEEIEKSKKDNKNGMAD
jgi:hypothetical protein